MKGLAFIALMMITADVGAAIRTVSNYPPTLAQYSSIQAAIDASVPGDSILIHGSPNAYTSFSISDKRLTILGPGVAPSISQSLGAVITGFCYISGSNAKKSEVQGLYFNGEVHCTSPVADSLRFYRNYFTQHFKFEIGGTTYKGYVFQNNFFAGRVIATNTTTYQDILFENNIFRNNDLSLYFMYQCVNVLFNHNLFYSSNSGTVSIANTIRLIHFANNIFVHRDFSAGTTPATQCTFTNNITFQCGDNTPWTSNGNFDGGGNIGNMDPQMADQAMVNNGTAGWTNDFTISAGPANNAGADGKDMGLLYDATGSLNWTISRDSRMPSVVSMTITNPTIVAGGTLNVNVTARRNN